MLESTCRWILFGWFVIVTASTLITVCVGREKAEIRHTPQENLLAVVHQALLWALLILGNALPWR